MKYLGERVVEVGKVQVGSWDIRNTGHWQRGICARLRRSIAARGIIEPLIVQEKGGRLILIDGHRRYAIAKELGLPRVRVLVVEASEDELKELVAVRHGTIELYDPLVKARMAILYRNSGMKIEEIAALLGCSEGYISDLVNIWSLGNGVVRALEQQKITIAHARLLLRLETANREEVLAEILEKGLKVYQARALIEGRSVVPWEEFRGALPPGVSAARVNGCIELKVRFTMLDELKEQLRALTRALRGAEELEAVHEKKGSKE